jgi:hypothetical protein
MLAWGEMTIAGVAIRTLDRRARRTFQVLGSVITA